MTTRFVESLKSLQPAERLWFWFSTAMEADRRPLLVLRRQSLDPEGQEYAQVIGMLSELSSEDGTTLEGFADVQPDGTLRFCSAEPARGAFPILARWAADHVAAAPHLRRLVGARYVYLDAGAQQMITEWEDDALWTALGPPDAAQAALIGDILDAAGPGAPLRAWVAPARNGQRAHIIVQNLHDDEAAFERAILKLRGQASGLRGVRATLTAHQGHMVLNTVEKSKSQLTAVAAMVRANLQAVPALGALLNLKMCLRDPQSGAAIKTLDQPELWADLKAPKVSSSDKRLRSLVNALEAQTERYQFWFDPSLSADRVPMILVPKDADLQAAVIASIGEERAKRKTALRGQAKRNGEGLIFRARTPCEGFLSALGELVSQHLDRAPALAALKGSRFKAVDAAGDILQKQRDNEMWSFA
ncbi:MAG: hypothetical protein AAFV53_20500 [Myxococcota bacterium]